MTSPYRAPSGPLPRGYETIRHDLYIPDGIRNIPGVYPFGIDAEGVFHANPDCRTDITTPEPPIKDSLQGIAPSIGQWLGVDPGICFCVPVPDEVQRSRLVLRKLAQFPTLPDPQRPVTVDNIGAFAQRLMHARRHIDQLPEEIADFTTVPVTPLEVANAAVLSDLLVRAAAFSAEIATLIHAPETGDVLHKATADRDEVVAALDSYQLHNKQSASLDGDLADLIALHYQVATTLERVALRAPRGLVHFVALHRRGMGYTEAHAEPEIETKALETALVLWEPDSTGAYRRWAHALNAAKLVL